MIRREYYLLIFAWANVTKGVWPKETEEIEKEQPSIISLFFRLLSFLSA
jgi:hypothetical protein